MPIGNTPLDAADIPLSSGLVKNVLDPVLLQGSENTTTDSNENISTPLNINLKQVGDALFALGQALKAASIPVTLASDQDTLPVLDTNSAANNTHLAAIDTATSDLVADLDALITNTAGLATQATLALAKTDLDTLAGIVSGSKGAIKASASDIVDLATLLTLAGTPTDANTVNSLMGRLTKIRDLLNATLTVQGTITEANSSSINTHLAAIDTDSASLVTNTTGLATQATLAAVKTDADTLVTNTTGLATQATLALAKTDLDTIVTNTNKIPASPATEGGHLATIDTSTAALNTLAGTSADANTVASFMGRLTKIRDLLLGFVFDNTDRLKTSLYVKTSAAADTILTLGRTTKAGSLPVTMASDQDNINVAVNAALPAGSAVIGSTTIQATSGTALVADQSNSELRVSNYVKTTTAGDTALTLGQTTMANSLPVTNASDQTPLVTSSATKTSVAGAASDTSLLASNANRKGATFYNDSTATLYLSYGSGTASTTSYTVQIPASGFFELPPAPVYTGAIRGIWSAANGNVRITELS